MLIYKKLDIYLKENIDYFVYNSYVKNNQNKLIKELKNYFKVVFLENKNLKHKKLTKRLIINLIKNNSIFI